jgi:hypothetical protein
MLFKFYNICFCVLFSNIRLISPHKAVKHNPFVPKCIHLSEHILHPRYLISNLFRSNVVCNIFCSLHFFSFKSPYLVLVFRNVVRWWSFRYSCCTLVRFQILNLYTNVMFR